MSVFVRVKGYEGTYHLTTIEPHLWERRLGTTVWLVVFVTLALVSIVAAFETAMHFNGVAIDGPFQLYNALRRIGAGFRPGVDFQFFHGLGVPYTHYALYRLFGGGLRGSELARELLTATIYPVVFLIAFRAFTKSWTQALALSAAGIALTYILRMPAMLFAMNGMLGYRSAIPTLLPAVLLIPDAKRRRIIAGVALGFALFISTEHGLAATLAMIVVFAVSAFRRADRREALIELGTIVGLAIAVLIALLLLIGGWSGMRGALRYNFRIVPMDQYWYFGAPPNVFISSWGALFPLFLRVPMVGLAIVLGLVVSILYLRRLARTEPVDPANRRTTALALLATYGLISCGSELGIYNLSYAQPCLRCLMIVGLLELHAFSVRKGAARGWKPFLGVPRIVAAASLAFGLWSATIPLVWTALLVSVPHVVFDHGFGGDGFSAGGIWPRTLASAQQAIDSHKSADGKLPMLWSTYAGWAEARNGMFHPSTDYIIHALGPENRAEYVRKFQALRPQLVQTVLPKYTQYEQWLEAENWPFYAALLTDYKVYSTTPWSIFWDRRPTPAEAPQFVGVFDVPPNIVDIPLPPLSGPKGQSQSVVLIEVEVDYETHNPLRALPLVGASPRFLVQVAGALTPVPVSLSPWSTTARFPLLLQPGRQASLHFRTYSLLPGASVRPKRVSVFVRRIDEENGPWIAAILEYLNSRS